MKGPASVPQWGADDAVDESDGPDSEDEKEELARWRKEKEKLKDVKVTETALCKITLGLSRSSAVVTNLPSIAVHG